MYVQYEHSWCMFQPLFCNMWKVWPSKVSQWPPIILKRGSCWPWMSTSCRKPWKGLKCQIQLGHSVLQGQLVHSVFCTLPVMFPGLQCVLYIASYVSWFTVCSVHCQLCFLVYSVFYTLPVVFPGLQCVLYIASYVSWFTVCSVHCQLCFLVYNVFYTLPVMFPGLQCVLYIASYVSWFTMCSVHCQLCFLVYNVFYILPVMFPSLQCVLYIASCVSWFTVCSVHCQLCFLVYSVFCILPVMFCFSWQIRFDKNAQLALLRFILLTTLSHVLAVCSVLVGRCTRFDQDVHFLRGCWCSAWSWCSWCWPSTSSCMSWPLSIPLLELSTTGYGTFAVSGKPANATRLASLCSWFFFFFWGGRGRGYGQLCFTFLLAGLGRRQSVPGLATFNDNDNEYLYSTPFLRSS